MGNWEAAERMLKFAYDICERSCTAHSERKRCSPNNSTEAQLGEDVAKAIVLDDPWTSFESAAQALAELYRRSFSRHGQAPDFAITGMESLLETLQRHSYKKSHRFDNLVECYSTLTDCITPISSNRNGNPMADALDEHVYQAHLWERDPGHCLSLHEELSAKSEDQSNALSADHSRLCWAIGCRLRTPALYCLYVAAVGTKLTNEPRMQRPLSLAARNGWPEIVDVLLEFVEWFGS